MDYSYLVGYKFGVIWEGEQSIEEYTIVSSNANISNNEVNVDTLFVRSLYEKNKGDVCNSNGNKFIIEYIVCPSFDNVVKERNIKHLYHFSALENINSIMQNGILSIDMLRRLNIKYDLNDNFRLDNHNNYISCSIEFPNGILLNNFKSKFGYKKKYVIFEIDIDVLNYKFARCCSINAATMGGNLIVGIDKLFTLYGGYRLNMPESFPTSEQAEILVKDKIETNYIKKIIFESEDDEKDFKNKYNTIVNPKMFDYRDKFLGYKMKFN